MKTVSKEIEDFCGRVKIIPAQFTGDVVINDDLWIEGDITIPPGFTPVVNGCMTILHDHIISRGFAPVVDGFLHLDSVSIIQSDFAPDVGSTLYLSGVTTIDDNFAPTVGNSIILDKIVNIGKGFAPIVGGNLGINRGAIIPADFAPVVGGTLYLDGGKPAKSKKLDLTKPLEARDGKYIISDNLVTEVVSKCGNVWRVKYIGENEVIYLVTDGSGNFAHGDTLEEAKESLIYKVSDRDMSKYKELSKDSELTFADAVRMYRTITGACSSGVQCFIESHNIKKKNYKIKEIVDLTVGQYGHEKLVKFFRI